MKTVCLNARSFFSSKRCRWINGSPLWRRLGGYYGSWTSVDSDGSHHWSPEIEKFDDNAKATEVSSCWLLLAATAILFSLLPRLIASNHVSSDQNPHYLLYIGPMGLYCPSIQGFIIAIIGVIGIPITWSNVFWCFCRPLHSTHAKAWEERRWLQGSSRDLLIRCNRVIEQLNLTQYSYQFAEKPSKS